MHRKLFVLLAVVVLAFTQFACGGTGEGATTEVDSPIATEPQPTPTLSPTVPEELEDVAIMQGNAVVHKEHGYLMSAQGIPQGVLDARAACFSALAQGTEDPPCTALQVAEYDRMPASCSNAGGQATKNGYCPR